MKKFILMMSLAALMVGCFEESATQAKSDSEESGDSLDGSSSSKKSSKSSSSKQVKSSSSKKGKSSSSRNEISLQSSSSIKIVFTINSSSSFQLPTVILGGASSSSQQTILIIDSPSSSSMTIIDVDPNSSASTAVVTGLGSCRPSKSPINKGESTTWSFTPNSAIVVDYGAMAFAQGRYEWNFGNLTEENPSVFTTSGKVTYPNSGTFGASLTVSITNKSTRSIEMETIACEPLQVNGDPIVGCQCTTDEAVVDFTVTPTMTWTVAGCTSNSTIVSYEWNGVAGSTEFTQAFASAANAYAPTLRVANDDNTVVDVTCDAVKVTDGPEYTFLESGPYGEIKLPAGKSTAILMFDASHFGYLSCKVDRRDSPTGSLSGSVNGILLKGSDYVATTLPSSMTVVGSVLDFDLDVPATCSVN